MEVTDPRYLARIELSRRLIEASRRNLEQLRYSLSPQSFAHIQVRGRFGAESQLQPAGSCGAGTKPPLDGEVNDKPQSTLGECPWCLLRKG